MALPRALLVAALLVVAGCSAPFGADTATESPEPTVETTGTATRAPTTTAPSGSEPTATTTATEPEVTATPTSTSTSTPTESGADGPAVRVIGGELPIDANRTYARLAGLLGTDAEAPERVSVVESSAASIPGSVAAVPDALARLGVVYEAPESNGSGPSYAGLTTSADSIRLNAAILNDTGDAELVLAHEYVHAVQFQQAAFYNTRRTIDATGIGPNQLYRATIEGAATYAMERYRRAYVPDEPSQVGQQMADYRRSDNPGRQFLVAPYAFGGRYLQERFESAANLSAVYESPPRTTEALIHGYAPGEEPPVPLSVAANGSEWFAVDSGDRVGELSTRIAIRTGTNDTVAAAAADGWGNDRLIEFRNGERTGYAWVLRWDDGKNATEFADHFGSYLDSRANLDDGLWRTGGGTAFRFVRNSERTTTVVFGAPAFVRGASTSGGANVTVSAP
jgi:hypothetical protein